MITVIYALEPPPLKIMSCLKFHFLLSVMAVKIWMMREGVFSGEVKVLHPWEAMPKSKHVKKETGVYFTYCHHSYLILVTWSFLLSGWSHCTFCCHIFCALFVLFLYLHSFISVDFLHVSFDYLNFLAFSLHIYLSPLFKWFCFINLPCDAFHSSIRIAIHLFSLCLLSVYFSPFLLLFILIFL